MREELEHHPYSPFVPIGAQKLILGSFPIGKFTNPKRRHEQSVNDMDFYYGGSTNTLWQLLGECFSLKLDSIDKIKKFLTKHHLALSDVIIACRRKNGGALDADLYDVEYHLALRELIQKYQFKEIIFTSRFVYNKFRAHIGKYPEITQTVLYSPSPNAVRGLAKNQEFLEMKKKNPALTVMEFRLLKYKQVFL